MTTAFALALLCITPPPEPAVRDYCDIIEVNHHHTFEGEFCYSKIIFWDFYAFDDEYHAWKFIMPAHQDGLLPPRWDEQRGVWVLMWTAEGTSRRMEAGYAKSSWTQSEKPCVVNGEASELEGDPYADDVRLFPNVKRRSLTRPIVSPIRPSSDTFSVPVAGEEVLQ